jgi:uncharacterized protein (UPF0147 family)
MGVKTVLAGITPSSTDIQQAASTGADLTGLMEEAQVKCAELIEQLTYIVNDVLTPAGDSGTISTINAQITALS